MDIKVMGYKNGKLVELGSNDEKCKCINNIINQIFRNDGKIEVNKIKNEENEEIRNQKNNKKEMVDYDREYNIHEVITLLKNMPKDTEVKCLKDKQKYSLVVGISKMDDIEHYDLLRRGDSDVFIITDQFNLSELLDLKFKLVEPQEKWIGIDSFSELISLLQNNKVNKLKVNGEDIYNLLDDTNKVSNLQAFTAMVMSEYDLDDLVYSSLEYVEAIK